MRKISWKELLIIVMACAAIACSRGSAPQKECSCDGSKEKPATGLDSFVQMDALKLPDGATKLFPDSK